VRKAYLIMFVGGLLLVGVGRAVAETGDELQARLDACNSGVISVPEGRVDLAQVLRVPRNDMVIHGYGSLMQTKTDAPVMVLENLSGVRLEGLTLTRPADLELATAPGLLLINCRDITIQNLRVVGQHGRDAAVEMRNCQDCTLRGCEIRDYKCVGVDDRTENDLYGYAFRCIDGTGILLRDSAGIQLQGNRIVEIRLLPTKEMKEKHQLGKLTEGKKPSKPGGRLAGGVFERGGVNNWHQGSAIVVTAPETTRHIQITDNYIENCAQGIDIHADFVTCANNTVKNGMMGVKATHGARNLIISGNMLTGIDLWGILLNPGAISHPATAEKEPNVDGGTVISGNVITDYGRGHEYWNWGGASDEAGGSYAIALYDGQLPENPPLRDVVVQGNVVYDSERDLPGPPKPRYRYALFVGSWHGDGADSPNMPQDLVITGNRFHPGRLGVSNYPPAANQ